jgi:hypothetical protein
MKQKRQTLTICLQFIADLLLAYYYYYYYHHHRRHHHHHHKVTNFIPCEVFV